MPTRARLASIVAWLTPTLAAILAGGCGGNDITLPAEGVPKNVTIVSGDGQSSAIGSTLPDRLIVRVTDSRDEAVANQPVTFSAGSGGSLAPVTATTAADGTAGTQWTLGPGAGVQQATALVTGDHAPANLLVTFHASGLTAAPAKLEKVAGDGQSAAAGTAVATRPAVKVTDAGGNPVMDVLVTFAVTDGDGAVASPLLVATDANGVATVSSWTLGNDPGQNLLTATISGSGVTGNPAVFTATAQVGSANKLVFVTQPSGVGVNSPISPAVTVQVQDAVGNLVNSDAQVVMTLGNNPTGATLSGTTTVSASGGTATFGNLRIDKAGTGYTLAATSLSGLIGASSAAFNVTSLQTTTSLASSPNPSVFGQSVTFTATVTSQLTPTGNIAFFRGNTCGGGTSLGAQSLSPAGTGTATASINVSTLPVGASQVVACYSGNETFEPSQGGTTQTVNQGTTQTAITNVSPEPSIVAAQITVTIQVSVLTGSGTPTGSATVSDGTSSCSIPDITASQSCSFTPASPIPGDIDLTATYSGDANFAGSSGQKTHTIVLPP